MSDIVVLGAGVIGASIAYHLAREGARVTLVDRAYPAEAPSASWASAGGLRSQGRYAHEHAITNAAAQRWRKLEDELESNLEVTHGGHLHLAETEAEEEVIRARVAADAKGGVAIELVTGNQLREIAPHITSRARLGAYTPGDGQAHPGRTAQAFARRAGELGAALRFGCAATLTRVGDGVEFRLDGSPVRCKRIVLATGAWSVDLLRHLGLEFPLRWRGLQMLLSEIAPPLLKPTVTGAGRNLSLKQSRTGQLMIGGRWFAQPKGETPRVEPIDAHAARQWSGAVAILPRMSNLKLAHLWAGAEAQSLDGSPFIGHSPLDGLYLTTGFSNHGFQISPEIGRLVARDLLGGGEPLLAPFAPARASRIGAEARAKFAAEPILL